MLQFKLTLQFIYFGLHSPCHKHVKTKHTQAIKLPPYSSSPAEKNQLVQPALAL